MKGFAGNVGTSLNRLFRKLSLLYLVVIGLSPAFAQTTDKPNFLVIVADDMGWADLGFLGSRIKTPNLDALVDRGVFLSNFYVAPSCSPTRSMLLTGVSNHMAGVGTMDRLQTPNQLGNINYAAQLHNGVVTVAEALQTQGYRTMMSGKWHLAPHDERQRPNRRGFDQSFGLLQGGASHFADQKQLTPLEAVDYLENGEPVELDPDFYTSIGYTDKIIEYIGGSRPQPFFAYLAYTAPHDPLQVPDDWLDRYDGVFDDGPEAAGTDINKKLIELSLLPADAARQPPLNFPFWLPSHRKPWADRTDEERQDTIRRMEIYAAMVELLDQQIGRVISHLDATNQLENTYVLFFSDNGASVGTPFVYRGSTREWVHEQFDFSFAKMGKKGSYTTMGREWAHVSNTPFRLFKGTVGDGGVRSPLIIAGGDLARGSLITTPAHVMDIAPTLFDLAGVETQTSPLYEGKLQPVGDSLVPLWQGGDFDRERMLITTQFGQRMVRWGQWKATFIHPPLGNATWELFDIVRDPGATQDLADDHPDVIAEIKDAYDAFAESNGVIDPDPILSVNTHVSFEGHCNWWCAVRFGFVDLMLNPRQRNMAFIALASVIGFAIFAVFFLRRRA